MRKILFSNKCSSNHASIKLPPPAPPLALTHPYLKPEPVFVDPLRSPEIDSQPGGPVRQTFLLYRPARQHRLAASIPRNRFLGFINIYKYGLRTQFNLFVLSPEAEFFDVIGTKVFRGFDSK